MTPAQRAKQFYVEGDYERALEIISNLLDDDPNNVEALFLAGGIFIRLNKRGYAHIFMARCLKHAEDRPEAWINFARTLPDDPEGWEQTEECLQHALQLHPQSRAALENLSALEVQRCNPEKSLQYALHALALDPTSATAKSCAGFAYLMLGEWKNGWEHYHAMMGHRSRPIVNYGDGLPEWDGTPGMNVVVSGEQGIGDELIYASFLPDMAKDCRNVIYDGMPRLSALMRRSMPKNVHMTGGRWSDEIELEQSQTPEARMSAAGVGMFYRKFDDDFPGTPYLQADTQMRLMMRSLLDSLPNGLKIGIAWTGGTKNSRQQFRQRTLEDLTPLLRTPGVTWVSLQYKDASEECRAYKEKRGITVHHFPWVTEQKEYDYTAALVKELDLVIAVPTSVTQLAGAMGVPCWVMVPKITGWLFHRDKYVWANSVRLFRNVQPRGIATQLQQFIADKISQEKAA